MTLVCIILVLLFERTQALDYLRNYRWFERYCRQLLRLLPGLEQQGATSLIILLLPVLLPMAALQYFLAGQFYDLFSFALAFVLLLYCLGNNLDRELKNYLHARSANLDQLAQQQASALLGKAAADNPDEQALQVAQAALQLAHRRWFAVLFWFVALGPVGALLYRLTCYSLHYSSSQALSLAARRVESVLAWAPVNMLAASFALAGDYENVSQSWRNKIRQPDLASCNYHTLHESGMAAIRPCAPGQSADCVHSIRQLLRRSLVIWLALIALLTLAGLA